MQRRNQGAVLASTFQGGGCRVSEAIARTLQVAEACGWGIREKAKGRAFLDKRWKPQEVGIA